MLSHMDNISPNNATNILAIREPMILKYTIV